MDLSSIVLLLHSWLRWAVLFAGLLAFGRAVVRRRRPWTPTDERAARWFTASLDVQFLLGGVLYFVFSPFTRAALQDFGAAMRTPALRFWAVEHVFGMVLALVLAHVGMARIRKASDDRRHRLAAIFFGLALAAVILSIPWPGMPNGRPLIRW